MSSRAATRPVLTHSPLCPIAWPRRHHTFWKLLDALHRCRDGSSVTRGDGGLGRRQPRLCPPGQDAHAGAMGFAAGDTPLRAALPMSDRPHCGTPCCGRAEQFLAETQTLVLEPSSDFARAYGRQHYTDKEGIGTDDIRLGAKPSTLLPPTPPTPERSPGGAGRLTGCKRHRASPGDQRGVTPVPPACPACGTGAQGTASPGGDTHTQHGALDISLASHGGAAHARGTARPRGSGAGQRAKAALLQPRFLSQPASHRAAPPPRLWAQAGCFRVQPRANQLWQPPRT